VAASPLDEPPIEVTALVIGAPEAAAHVRRWISGHPVSASETPDKR
jgi:hypothetical protein